MNRRGHAMPFGTLCREDGAVRFRLWAPAARRIELCLAGDERERLIAMPQTGDGWYELITDATATAGRFRYRIDDGLQVPEPMSRFQPRGLHGFSEIIDPLSFVWQEDD